MKVKVKAFLTILLCIAVFSSHVVSVGAVSPYPLTSIVISPEVAEDWADSDENFVTYLNNSGTAPTTWSGTYTYDSSMTPTLNEGVFGSPLDASQAKFLWGNGRVYVNVTSMDSSKPYVNISFYYYEEKDIQSAIYLRYRSLNNRSEGYKEIELRRPGFTFANISANTGRWVLASADIDDAFFDAEGSIASDAVWDFYITSESRFMVSRIKVTEKTADNVDVLHLYDHTKLAERYISNHVTNNTSISNLFIKEISRCTTVGSVTSENNPRHLAFETINNAFSPEDPTNSSLKFEIIYRDVGTGNMEFTYMSSDGAKAITKARTNTSMWKTWTIVVKDAILDNTLVLYTQTGASVSTPISNISFGISNRSASDALMVRSVDVEKITGNYAVSMYFSYSANNETFWTNPSSVIGGNYIRATADVMLLDGEDEDMILIIGLYDGKGMLLDTTFGALTTDGENWASTTSPSVMFPSVLDKHYIKAFLWKGTSLSDTLMCPIGETKILK